MGNGYNHHQYVRHQSGLLHLRSTNFLPMLCSRPSSIKDVHLPKSSSSASSKDPSSPKVSCMGQVKRSNRVIGFPTPAYRFNSSFAPKSASAASNVKYHKLKRLFSGKNLTPTATATNNVRRKEIVNHAPVNIAELDPPLPVVIKRVPQPPEADGSLWKRRSGGAALKSLQLQKIQMPNNCNQTHCIQSIPTV